MMTSDAVQACLSVAVAPPRPRPSMQAAVDALQDAVWRAEQDCRHLEAQGVAMDVPMRRLGELLAGVLALEALQAQAVVPCECCQDSGTVMADVGDSPECSYEARCPRGCLTPEQRGEL